MTIDYNKNDYVKVGHYSNVVMELRKDRGSKTYDDRAYLCSFMEKLIYKVALQHPEWTIVAFDPHFDARAEAWRGHRFKVYSGTELVGHILRDGYSEEIFKYEVYNDRISKARCKRGGMCTKDLKKAVKHVEEYFQPKSLEERRATAITEIQNHIQSVDWRTTRVMNETVSRIMPALAAYLSLNMAEVRPVLEGFGAPPQTLDDLPNQIEKVKAVWQLRDARANKTGTTVRLIDDRYMLIPDADPMAATLVTNSQLTPEQSRKIGVLKVFDETEEALEGIGLRMDAQTFYLLP